MKGSECASTANWIVGWMLVLIVAACSSSTEAPGPTSIAVATDALPLASWDVYANETWGFSLEHPADWLISAAGSQAGFIGKQVFWWAGDQDPLQLHGDDPAADERADTEIGGQPARRIVGHYQGAVGDMGFQQYLRYVIQNGDTYYMFTLYAVDALGVPPEMINAELPLRETDIELFEQMMATVTFNP
jgi:hypothetical protein